MEKKEKTRKLKIFRMFFALERDLIVGGQAVIEGVMMRTPSAYAIACRKSDGEIVTTAEKLPRWNDKYKWLNLPVLRGGATLIQSMALGIKALNFSARVYEEDLKARESREKAKELQTEAILIEGTADKNFLKAKPKVIMPEKTKAKKQTDSASAVGSIIFALGFNILLFIVAPLVLTNLLFIALGWANAPIVAADANWWKTALAYVWKIKLDSFGGWVAFNLIDGLIRIVFFILMIFSMSFLKDIYRLFQYHGAEHKTVFNWESGSELTIQNAKLQKRQHPRCGTSFLMVVMLVAIVLFSFINFEAMWLNLVVRIALMPLVAGLSYEVIRYAAKKESGTIFKFMTLPGLWLQNITTQEPNEQQLEVAIAALQESLKLEPQES